MANRVQWSGLEDFKRALRMLPQELAGEAGNLVEAVANSAAVDIRSAYGAHRYTGNLQKSVRVTHRERQFGMASTVKVTAPHAHLFEFGTQARHTKAGVSRGSMPPFNIFLPRIRRAQRQMYERLKGMLARHG